MTILVEKSAKTLEEGVQNLIEGSKLDYAKWTEKAVLKVQVIMKKLLLSLKTSVQYDLDKIILKLSVTILFTLLSSKNLLQKLKQWVLRLVTF